MDKWNLSAMYDKFWNHGIRASTMWDMSEESLLQMQLQEDEQLMFRQDRKLYGKEHNTPGLPPAIYLQSSYNSK